MGGTSIQVDSTDARRPSLGGAHSAPPRGRALRAGAPSLGGPGDGDPPLPKAVEHAFRARRPMPIDKKSWKKGVPQVL